MIYLLILWSLGRYFWNAETGVSSFDHPAHGPLPAGWGLVLSESGSGELSYEHRDGRSSEDFPGLENDDDVADDDDDDDDANAR